MVTNIYVLTSNKLDVKKCADYWIIGNAEAVQKKKIF